MKKKCFKRAVSLSPGALLMQNDRKTLSRTKTDTHCYHLVHNLHHTQRSESSSFSGTVHASPPSAGSQPYNSKWGKCESWSWSLMSAVPLTWSLSSASFTAALQPAHALCPPATSPSQMYCKVPPSQIILRPMLEACCTLCSARESKQSLLLPTPPQIHPLLPTPPTSHAFLWFLNVASPARSQVSVGPQWGHTSGHTVPPACCRIILHRGARAAALWTAGLRQGTETAGKGTKASPCKRYPKAQGHSTQPLCQRSRFFFSFMSSQAVGEGQENKKVAQSPHSLLRPHLSHLGSAEKSRTHLPGLVMRQSQNTWNTWRVYCYLRLPPNFHSFKEFPVPDLLLIC